MNDNKKEILLQKGKNVIKVRKKVRDIYGHDVILIYLNLIKSMKRWKKLSKSDTLVDVISVRN